MTFEIDQRERRVLVLAVAWAIEHLQRNGGRIHRPLFECLLRLASRLGVRFACSCGDAGLTAEQALTHKGAVMEQELQPILNPKGWIH